MSTQTETKPTETKPVADIICTHCGSQYSRESRVSAVFDCGTRVNGNKHAISKACLIIRRLKDDLANGQRDMFPKL